VAIAALVKIGGGETVAAGKPQQCPSLRAADSKTLGKCHTILKSNCRSGYRYRSSARGCSGASVGLGMIVVVHIWSVMAICSPLSPVHDSESLIIICFISLWPPLARGTDGQQGLMAVYPASILAGKAASIVGPSASQSHDRSSLSTTECRCSASLHPFLSPAVNN
jgi:hypothetical protein